MTYYDHATAMAYGLDRWSESPTPGDIEQEWKARERRALIRPSVLPSLLQRLFADFRRCGCIYYSALVSPHR